MEEQKESWVKRNYKYLEDTMAPKDPLDSKFTKFKKKVGFIMFLILLVVTTLSLTIAISFTH